MKQIISDLWNGNVAQCEHCGSHDSELNHIIGLMERNRETLWEGLTATQKEIFQRYMEGADKYLLRMSELAFCDGFRLAGKIFAAVFCDDN